MLDASGGKSETRWPWPLAIIVWLIFVGAMSYALFPRIAELNLNDSDDYMRLVQVEAWLDGADWRDTHMERLNPPDGVVMHWSRLPDVPIALVIAIVEPFTDRDTAKKAALFVVPSVYFLLFLLLITWVAARTMGQSAAFLAPILTAFALPAAGQFAPGRIDHHGLQILLAILMLTAVIQLFKGPSGRWAAVMGLAGGLSIAIGAEGLPHVIAGYLCLGLGWVLGREHLLRAGVVMATATAGTTALVLITTVPQSPYLVAACDALSMVYVTATALIAVIWLVLWALKNRLSSPISRTVVAGALAALAGGLLLTAFPQCSSGPYAALPPELVETWLSAVDEAQTARQLLGNNFGQFALYFALPLIALGSLVWIAFRRRPVPEYLIPLAVFLVLTFLVSLIQVRAGSIANAIAILGALPLYIALVTWIEQRVKIFSRLAAIAVLIVFSPPAIYRAANAINPPPQVQPHDTKPCNLPTSLEALDKLPQGTIMAPSNMGAMILAFTDHAVVGAPYHRNVSGLMASLNFYSAQSSVDAHAVILDRNVTYLLVCNRDGPYGIPLKQRAGSMAEALAIGALPEWLTPLLSQDDLEVYQVTP